MILATFLIQSCSSEFLDEGNPQIPPEETNQTDAVTPSSTEGHRVRYTLSGDFSGTLDVTFLSSNIPAPEQQKGLFSPWEFTYQIPDSTQAIGGFANGLYGDGMPGETAQMTLSLDDVLLETVIRQADDSGYVTLPMESFHLGERPLGKTIAAENTGKEVEYRVDGNYSGRIMLIYYVEDGSRRNIEISGLPWSEQFITDSHSWRASVYGLGATGLEGEQVNLSLWIEGELVGAVEAVADMNGEIHLLPEVHHFFE